VLFCVGGTPKDGSACVIFLHGFGFFPGFLPVVWNLRLACPWLFPLAPSGLPVLIDVRFFITVLFVFLSTYDHKFFLPLETRWAFKCPIMLAGLH